MFPVKNYRAISERTAHVHTEHPATQLGERSRLLRWRVRLADFRGRGIYQGWPNAKRAIFIHIPKTAGTSVAQALYGGSRHVPYFEYERANRRKFRLFFKFAFVRNPWDRIVSTYFFLKGGGVNEMDRRFASEHLAAYDNFAAFVEGWLTRENIWSYVHFKPQYYFICDPRLRLRVNFVGRTETIAEDFRYVCQRLAIEAELGWANRSGHRRYREYYNDELRKRVAEVYAEDIALFDYEFDGRQHPVSFQASNPE